jgi:hypothetical protein
MKKALIGNRRPTSTGHFFCTQPHAINGVFMKHLHFLFLAFVMSLLGACSNSSKFDGAWSVSIEQTKQANKEEAAKNPMYELGLNLVKAALGELTITKNVFEFGVEEKRMVCTIDPSLEKNNTTCVNKKDNTAEKGKVTIKIVDGLLHFAGDDGKMTLVFAKKDANSAAEAKATAEAKQAVQAVEGLANMANALNPQNTTAAAAPAAAEVAPAPAAAPSAPAKDPSDTCAAGSKTLFSCMTEKGKRIELCDAGAKMMYSYGKPGASEINLAVDRNNASTHQWEGMGANEYYSVKIGRAHV